MKKLIALFLVFSLLVLSGNLFAKERRGAELMVDKKDGQQVRGELIAVKKSSLLFLDSASGADVSVDIENIRTIKIMKKSKFCRGAGYGALIGGGTGVIFGIFDSIGARGDHDHGVIDLEPPPVFLALAS